MAPNAELLRRLFPRFKNAANRTEGRCLGAFAVCEKTLDETVSATRRNVFYLARGIEASREILDVFGLAGVEVIEPWPQHER
jgi:hypothetical protein